MSSRKRPVAAGAIHLRRRVLGAALAACAPAAFANQGLVASASDWLWPQLQARITLQTAALSPMSLTRLSDAGAASRSLQGASLLGDYVIATPGFGSFRATSGVLLGAQSGVPVLSALAASRLEVTVLDGGFVGAAAEAPATLPYLGLGYTSATLWRSVSLSADLGVVAGRHGSLSGLGRAVLGNQNFDSAVRDMRLAPVLQLGVRYSF
ncbi:MAG: hypothetical protein JNL30_00770 [Rubrivivax sp.]|nr:hypothetical protein [Rubrivivax sp.]